MMNSRDKSRNWLRYLACTIIAILVVLLILYITLVIIAVNNVGIESGWGEGELERHRQSVQLQFVSRTPQWSSDGETIIVNIYDSIYAINTDGEDLRWIPKEKSSGSKYGEFTPALLNEGRVAYRVYLDNSILEENLGGLFDFITPPDGNYIESARLDGSDVKRVAYTGDLISNPFLSSDGSRIAFFTSEHGLTTAKSDGSNVHRTDSDLIGWAGRWSNDGQRVAVLTSRDESRRTHALVNMRWDGADAIIIAEALGDEPVISLPDWSPSDDRLYFAKKDQATPPWPTKLYSVGNDGSDLRMIANLGVGKVNEVAVSPDGRELLFATGDGVYLMNTDGANLTNLTNTYDFTNDRVYAPDRESSLNIRYASWSPDGNRIAVLNHGEIPIVDGHRLVLFTMARDGSDVRALITGIPPQPGHGELLQPAQAPAKDSQGMSGDADPCGYETSCEPRDVSGLTMLNPQVSGAAFEYDFPDTEELLEKGMHAAGASPTHIAARAAARKGTVRCAWRNVVRTAGQRDEAVRFWLGMDEDDALPSPTELESTFESYIVQMDPRVRDEMRVNFKTLAHGGVSTDALFLTCYVDYDMREYILGAGPSVVTVAYDQMAQSRSYDLYKLSHAAGKYGDGPLLSASEFASEQSETVSQTESDMREAVEDRESVVFLAPMGAHNAIAIEVWQAVAQWDLQRVDGAVNAVRYGTDAQDVEHVQALSSLKSRVVTAAAGDSFAGKRIGNVNGLTGYYRGIGAYGNIGPFGTGAVGGAAENLFTPGKPPLPYGQPTSAGDATPTVTPTPTPTATPTPISGSS